jgi:hypothetical protein
MSKSLSENSNQTDSTDVVVIRLDRVGMILSMICLVHCLMTPVLLISLPILARYYIAHPLFHLVLALLIIPVGLVAFYSGYKHHHNFWVLLLGAPGLVIITGVPYLVHQMQLPLSEVLFMSIGSIMMLSAHWINRKSCQQCSHHQHS